MSLRPFNEPDTISKHI